MDDTNKLQVIFGDITLGVRGNGFHMIFSYQTGGLESLVYDGKEWLYRTPKPTFWRATTDNDRGCGFHVKSGMWYSADMFLPCVSGQIFVDGSEVTDYRAPYNNRYSNHEYAQTVKLIFIYRTITVPSTEVAVSYEVDVTGAIKTSVHYKGKKGLPSLPVFGMRFVMPTKAIGYEYEGVSGETYPDRMAGGVEGTYYVEGLPVTPYIVPQDCNVRMNTKRATIFRETTLNNADQEKKTFGLTFEQSSEPFAFSCIPYTSQELESATHQEELPLARRTVVGILGAVRGVGGINSWGADVEVKYTIDAEQDIQYSFVIRNS